MDGTLTIIDEVYKSYKTKIIQMIESWDVKYQKILNSEAGGCRPYSQDKFIERIKIDLEFSEKWGLKIEERELSLEERLYLVNYDKEKFTSIQEWINWYNNEPVEFYYMGINYNKETALTDLDVPTKLITLSYNNETIEVYE
jgi:hypothetical protein